MWLAKVFKKFYEFGKFLKTFFANRNFFQFFFSRVKIVIRNKSGCERYTGRGTFRSADHKAVIPPTPTFGV
jgi:hypothetical protein